MWWYHAWTIENENLLQFNTSWLASLRTRYSFKFFLFIFWFYLEKIFLFKEMVGGPGDPPAPLSLRLWKVLKTLYWKRLLFLWLCFDERWNVFAKICTNVGVDKEGNLNKGIIAFMVVGLKQPIPFVVQAIPEVICNGHSLAEKISDNIDNLIELGLCVQSIVTGNQSANVNGFSAVIKANLMSGGNKRSCRYT